MKKLLVLACLLPVMCGCNNSSTKLKWAEDQVISYAKYQLMEIEILKAETELLKPNYYHTYLLYQFTYKPKEAFYRDYLLIDLDGKARITVLEKY